MVEPVLVKEETDAKRDYSAVLYIGDPDWVKDRYEQLKEIKKALAVDPKHQMAMFNLGVILLSDNKVEESKQWLQKTIDIDPNSLAGERAKEILHQH